MIIIEGRLVARLVTPEAFVAEDWATRAEPVFAYGHTGHYRNGAAIHRLMQVLTVRVEPHIHNDGSESCGKDYHWTMFDFETGQLQSVVCWGSGPQLYVFAEDLEQE